MHQVAPGAELFMLPSGVKIEGGHTTGNLIEKTLKYAATEGVHIINASLGGVNNKILNDEMLKVREKGVVFVTSAGNDGSKGVKGYAKSDVWISVAAVHLEDKNKMELAKYSSTGKELDFSSFSNLSVHDSREKGRTFKVQGTSFSSPLLAGMLALVQQFYIENTGKALNQDEMYRFIQKHSIDLGEVGFDEYFGYGLFVLPDPEILKKEVTKVNKPEKIIIHHSLTKDGEVKDYDAIKKYHLSQGYNDIGYHWIIEKVNGEYILLKGRDEKVTGAHTKGENERSIGICLVGNFDEYEPNTEQLDTLVELCKDIFARHGKMPIEPHRKYANYKTCPGTKFPLNKVLTRVFMQNTPDLSEVSDWAKESWTKSVKIGINDSKGAKNYVTEEQLMVFFDRLGLLD